MASSLEELLAEEGFRGRRSMARSRTSVRSDFANVPVYRYHGRPKTDSAYGNGSKTERTRSDISRYSFNGKLSRDDNIGVRRSRDRLITTGRIVGGSAKEAHAKTEHVDDIVESNASSIDHMSSKENVRNERSERIRDTSVNEMDNFWRKDKLPNGSDDGKKSSEELGKEMLLNKKRDSSLKKHHLGQIQPESFNERSYGSSLTSKSFEDNQNQKDAFSTFPDFVPALDEVAIQATISILTGYSKRFLRDGDFRKALHDTCFCCLNYVRSGEYPANWGKVISNLMQAIKTVEQAAEESASAKDLKRASLQLSVITGLNSNDLKDGLTCGIPNYQLSAFAHLYLSVIYKLRKKDRASAKHLLQVFSDSPFQARTILLPELWENMFYPHLSHLKLWHGQEADSLGDNPNRERRLKLLDKVYNEILDSGTYQFAIYYKDWLTEGFEAPSIPSISIPALSVQEIQLNGSRSHSAELADLPSTFCAQPTMSKGSSEDAFGDSSEPGIDDGEDEEAEKCQSCMESSDQVKETLTFSSETVKHMDQCSVENAAKNPEDDAFLLEDVLPFIDEVGRSPMKASCSLQRDSKAEGNCSSTSQQIMDGTDMMKSSSINTIRTKFTLEESRSREGCDEWCFSNILKHFICPLTGKLFEDPVTLENGYTYERVAISKWFDQGNRTCPVTGKDLECFTLPDTNIVIKGVIDCWGYGHCKRHVAFASQAMVKEESHEFRHEDDGDIFKLKQVLTTSDKEEQIVHATHLISLGGVQFLIQRFEVGAVEEKQNILELMSICIEFDANCRSQIGMGINKKSLLDLLHSKQFQERRNAVSLLIELICLNRREEAMSFLHDLSHEEMVNAMHSLLLYLQCAPIEEKPLIALLLLHFDLQVEPRKYSIYREEAVDAIAMAIDLSFNHENLRESCFKSLLILGGHFSLSTRLFPELWILKQEGFSETYKAIFCNNEEQGLLIDNTSENEELAYQEWLKNLVTAFLSSRKRSLVVAISNCLSLNDSKMVRVCLIMVAWLSSALPLLCDAEFQLSAFSALVQPLKEKLESGEEIEDKILAAFCLLNFCKIPECRVLLATMAEEITAPLRSIADVTWTAKQLCELIFGDHV